MNKNTKPSFSNRFPLPHIHTSWEFLPWVIAPICGNQHQLGLFGSQGQLIGAVFTGLTMPKLAELINAQFLEVSERQLADGLLPMVLLMPPSEDGYFEQLRKLVRHTEPQEPAPPPEP